MGVLSVSAWLKLKDFESVGLPESVDKFLNRLLAQQSLYIKPYVTEPSTAPVPAEESPNPS